MQGGCVGVGNRVRDWRGAMLKADSEGDGRVTKANLLKVHF